MAIITYVDQQGNYVGTADRPIEGAIAVPDTPDDARRVWNFETQAWGPVPDTLDPDLTLGEAEAIVNMFPVSYPIIFARLGFGDVV